MRDRQIDRPGDRLRERGEVGKREERKRNQEEERGRGKRKRKRKEESK